MSISRRDLIKSLSLTVATGSVLRVVPLAAAETAHRMVSAHKAAPSSGEYAPKFFPEHQYKTLRALCQAIIPSVQESGGAIEAGAPEFLALREKGAQHPIEATGKELRALFAWKQQDADYTDGSAAR